MSHNQFTEYSEIYLIIKGEGVVIKITKDELIEQIKTASLFVKPPS